MEEVRKILKGYISNGLITTVALYASTEGISIPTATKRLSLKYTPFNIGNNSYLYCFDENICKWLSNQFLVGNITTAAYYAESMQIKLETARTRLYRWDCENIGNKRYLYIKRD